MDTNDSKLDWLLVFSLSKANGAKYQGEELPQHKWQWPQDTYLKRRLPKVVAQTGSDSNR